VNAGYDAADVTVPSLEKGSPRALDPASVAINWAFTLLLAGCPATPASQTEQAATNQSGPHFVLAPTSGDVVEIVKAERERANAAGQRLIVYVGASWCEPCQYFHAAVDDGSLDAALPRLRLLEFDLDHDRERLLAAGYGSRMIPLFVVPGPDGRAGPRRMEGSVKGPAAIDDLRTRLGALLQAAAGDERRP
jgi:thiol:disulfide interchange protein